MRHLYFYWFGSSQIGESVKAQSISACPFSSNDKMAVEIFPSTALVRCRYGISITKVAILGYHSNIAVVADFSDLPIRFRSVSGNSGGRDVDELA